MSFTYSFCQSFFLLLSLFCLLSISPISKAAYVVHLNLSKVEGNGWQVRDAKLELTWHAAEHIEVHLVVASLQLPPPLEHLKGMEVECVQASMRDGVVRCDSGTLQFHTPLLDHAPIRVSFAYQHDARMGSFSLHNIGIASGTANIDGRFDSSEWRLDLSANTLDVAQLTKTLSLLAPSTILSPDTLTISAGSLSLNASVTGKDTQPQTVTLRGTLTQLTFTDRDARRAGEQLATTLAINATAHDSEWRFTTELQAQQGQLYIEPIFLPISLARPLSFSATGSWQPHTGQCDLPQLRFYHPGILTANGQAQLGTHNAVQLISAQFQVPPTAFDSLYKTYLQPFLIGTTLDTLETSGHISLSLDYRREGASIATITVDDVDLDDQKGRYGLHGLSGKLVWTNEQTAPLPSHLRWRDGHVYTLSLGASKFTGEVHGDSARLLRPMAMPILDGQLHIDRFSSTHVGTPQLRWEFAGRLAPASMEVFSQAMGWPTLSGQFSGTIPQMTYADGHVTVDGSLQIQVFDGEIAVHNLRLQQPFSIVPQLSADIDLNNVDLERLTGAFSFGKITGRLSGRLHQLHLQDWQPVAFDAHFATPPDDHSKHTISQKAVDNLSSLGGIGGALSRSFLRVFDEFSYDRLGIRCRLHNGICEMGGLEPINDGYYIVKGGGLPRIDIIGHARQVDWPELLERLKRATKSSGPVLQ